jgi:hypothetical protein
MTKTQNISDSSWKQKWSHDSNNVAQHIATEHSDAEKCETISNSDISSSSNSFKINTAADLSVCNKSINSETTDARTQQQEVTQLHNNTSKVTDTELEIKPLTDIVIKLEDIKPGYYVTYTYHNFPHSAFFSYIFCIFLISSQEANIDRFL